MKRFNCILNDEKYRYYLKKNEECEVNRKFCKHDLEHFLAVARIAQEINLEENLGFQKEIIYTTSILHDIGRAEQYEKGISHEIASWELSKNILEKYKYNQEEIELIKEGILGHREITHNDTFAKLMSKSDKLSRLCITCDSMSECNWKDEKKNIQIYY